MIYDISFPLSPETMVYPGDPPFLREVLLDVVPFMFPMLIAYTVILVAANGLLLFAGKKGH